MSHSISVIYNFVDRKLKATVCIINTSNAKTSEQYLYCIKPYVLKAWSKNGIVYF
ncbi:hypothetical protein L910_1561 [Vibrio fluvialis PG41]|uniref:Uncharacterized protein n=1 Tax=Vibrio fluvialis PG41 TaxID=1336752 RepID=S7HZH6_VIBFL|nr:hypothetical protein L910_1561 [Vibrio fluvialis PG41]